MTTAPEQGASGEVLTDFRRLYFAEWPRLLASLRYCGASFDEAEDAAAAAFLELYQTRHLVKHPAAWLRTVAMRLFVKERRHDLEAVRPYGMAGELLSHQHSPDDHVAWNDVIELLRTLPPTQRQVMAWAVDGYSPSEIATILGMSPDTARSHLRHARHALAARLTAAEDP
jgi:RNA polymerase sigma factor (sigma-70 family)